MGFSISNLIIITVSVLIILCNEYSDASNIGTLHDINTLVLVLKTVIRLVPSYFS